ncbi:uncharacterized protein LOC127787192 [Diospyros lotus]|uniref:uncharacterized protein LOC127787192 n=1 Tax=Diospyros lotus TaxID=55363 RepID=UPI002256AEA4|nr:uncharacterized protein LOC127787192 [Diospyros lotus]
MAEPYLMASHGYPPGLLFHPDQGSPRVSKDVQVPWHSSGTRYDTIRLDTFNVRPNRSEELWESTSGFPNTAQFAKANSTITRPVLVDVQDTQPNSILFSFGVAEQCTRHDKIMKFLMSGSEEVEGGSLDMSMLSDLMGLQVWTIHNIEPNPFAPSSGPCGRSAGAQPYLIYPGSEFNSQRPLLELVGDLAHRSDVTFHPNGQISSNELKDILSIIAEYYLSKNSTEGKRQSVLIPHFNWLDSGVRANVPESSAVLENVKFAPLKSPDKIKLRPSPRKRTNKKAKERDLYRKNYFHACESLLSIIINKRHNEKTAFLSLKKSGPEVPQLLTQFSASIAGTGLAVLFSVMCKVAYSRVPFCASRLLSTSIGFGLVWLSSAVNRLRDTVVHVSKNSGKLKLKEEEMMKKLDKCVNQIFFRAATLMAIAVLKLA